MLICIEGLDACGKDTQSRRLSERLQCRRIAFPTYSNEIPAALSGPIIAAHLKRAWEAMTEVGPDANLDAFVFQCVMATNKYEMAPQIEALVNYGSHVVVDRYWQSGYAFGGADGLDRNWLIQIHKSLPQPDLNILLDVDFETSWARRPERRDRYERMGKDFYDTVRANYLALWRVHAREHKLPGRWAVLDGRKAVEEVAADIDQLVCSAP